MSGVEVRMGVGQGWGEGGRWGVQVETQMSVRRGEEVGEAGLHTMQFAIQVLCALYSSCALPVARAI